MKTISVVEYNSDWPDQFEKLKLSLEGVLGPIALTIEHVGSTSVPDLKAKPIIDIDVVTTQAKVREAIDRLSTIGYIHRGNLGIEGREAFANPHENPKHNLYLCLEGSLGLRNHLAIRNSLREKPELRDEYSKLKSELAIKFSDNIDSYIHGKTEFLLSILKSSGFLEKELESIRQANSID